MDPTKTSLGFLHILGKKKQFSTCNDNQWLRLPKLEFGQYIWFTSNNKWLCFSYSRVVS